MSSSVFFENRRIEFIHKCCDTGSRQKFIESKLIKGAHGKRRCTCTRNETQSTRHEESHRFSSFTTHFHPNFSPEPRHSLPNLFIFHLPNST